MHMLQVVSHLRLDLQRDLDTLTMWVRLFASSSWWFLQHSSQVNLCLTTLRGASLKIVPTNSFQWKLQSYLWITRWDILCQSPLENVPESWSDRYAEPLFKLLSGKEIFNKFHILYIVPIVPIPHSTKPKPTHLQSVFPSVFRCGFLIWPKEWRWANFRSTRSLTEIGLVEG